MSNLLLIWGAGGHGKVVLDIARSTGRFERIAFLDDNPGRAGLTLFMFCDCPLMVGPEELYRFAGSTSVVAIGDNRTRARCFARALGNALAPRVLVHPGTCLRRPSLSMSRSTSGSSWRQ